MYRVSANTTQNKMVAHEIAEKLWKIKGTDFFTLNNSLLLYDVDFHCKLPIVR